MNKKTKISIEALQNIFNEINKKVDDNTLNHQMDKTLGLNFMDWWKSLSTKSRLNIIRGYYNPVKNRKAVKILLENNRTLYPKVNMIDAASLYYTVKALDEAGLTI